MHVRFNRGMCLFLTRIPSANLINQQIPGPKFRFKRVGSSHGRIDPHNPNKFAGASTFSADFTQHGYSRPSQIRPVENNIEFGKDGGEHNTTHREFNAKQ